VTTAREQRLLAYTEARGDWNIWELPRAPGETPRRIVASSRPDMRPAQSPDGRQLAFVSMRGGRAQIWLADADGGEARPLLRAAGREPDDLAWSPDGTRLAYTATQGGRLAICVVEPASGTARVLTPPDRSEARPAWSPDGAWLYFCRRHEGRLQIWRRPVAGGEAERVTRGGGYRALAAPDATTLYFMRARPDTSGLWGVPAGGGQEGLVVALEGEVLVDVGLGPAGPVLCTASNPEAESYRIWQWRPATGGRELVAEIVSRRPPRLDVHPRTGRILVDRTERLESDLVGLRHY
jgi:Tol biopolymer transport system component